MQFQQFSSSLLEGAKVTDGPPSFENEGAMAALAPPLPTPLYTPVFYTSDKTDNTAVDRILPTAVIATMARRAFKGGSGAGARPLIFGRHRLLSFFNSV